VKCCLPFCSYKGLNPSTFGVPKEISLKIKWEKALGVTLKDKSRICQYHFKNEDILHTWVSGLKITLKSTIDLVNYLLDEKQFAYDLTAKFNQDCLEVIYNHKY